MSFAYIDFVRLCRISTTLSAAHKFRLFSNNIVNDVDVDVNGITLVEHSTFSTFNKKNLFEIKFDRWSFWNFFLLYLCACMFERMYVCVQSISQDCKLISIGIMTKHIERYILASIHCLFFFLSFVFPTETFIHWNIQNYIKYTLRLLFGSSLSLSICSTHISHSLSVSVNVCACILFSIISGLGILLCCFCFCSPIKIIWKPWEIY